jgi:hypothetical protein
LRSNTKGYEGKTDYTYSQNSDTTAPSDRELYHIQFLLQAASLETFGYTLICLPVGYLRIFYQLYGYATHMIIYDELKIITE